MLLVIHVSDIHINDFFACTFRSELFMWGIDSVTLIYYLNNLLGLFAFLFISKKYDMYKVFLMICCQFSKL